MITDPPSERAGCRKRPFREGDRSFRRSRRVEDVHPRFRRARSRFAKAWARSVREALQTADARPVAFAYQLTSRSRTALDAAFADLAGRPPILCMPCCRRLWLLAA